MSDGLVVRGSNSGLVISFAADIDEVIGALAETDRWVGPYVTASALSATARDAQQAEQKALNASFDRPVALTRRAVLYRKATREELTAEVFIRDEAPGGVPPARYLAPQIEGGPRRPKSHELRLRRAGILGPNEFAVPARNALLDSFGNIKGGTFEQMLSQLQAAEQFAGYMANETKRSRRRAGVRRTSRFFVADGKRGGLPRGIYERIGQGHRAKVRGFLLFVDGAPDYRIRYRFGEAARTKALRVFGGHWASYFERFVASGKIMRRG